MFSSRIAVVVVLAVASTGSAFQNEGETRNIMMSSVDFVGGWGGGGALRADEKEGRAQMSRVCLSNKHGGKRDTCSKGH